MSLRAWSERETNPQHPGWHDCWVAARLSELSAAGFDAFPLGAYTDPEREAAERAQTRVAPEGPGDMLAGDAFLANRYGVVDHSSADLPGLLARPGLAVAAIGVNARLVARLRHWDPVFSGTHMATIATGTGGRHTFLDPEGPMGYPGEAITSAEVLAWWAGGAVRFLAIGELSMTTVLLTAYTPARLAHFAPGTYVGHDPATLAPAHAVTIGPAGSSASLAASGTISPAPSWAPGGQVHKVANGAFAGLLLPRAGITPDPAPPPADCSAQVAKAVAGRDAAWRTAIAKVAP